MIVKVLRYVSSPAWLSASCVVSAGAEGWQGVRSVVAAQSHRTHCLELQPSVYEAIPQHASF